MKNIILTLATAGALGAVAAPAAAETFGDVARVISATPIYERVSASRRECRTEEVRGYEERRAVEPHYYVHREAPSGAGTVLGAIIGGVLGHQVDRGGGTAAGAVIGGLVGNSIERDAHAGYRTASRDVVVERVPVTREVQRCRDVPDTRERLVGYDVRYEYNGRELRTRLPYDPGPEMAVNVDVRPPAAGYTRGRSAPRYREF